ncbi:hypothetical protein [Rhodococcus maanshanensis]|uniref:Uncharacterized protein n=1 Tax=Rhodococcus maanshanensis TaxID=183556 RepID=A0A1H7SMF8_9NOCA|nr:hypothetical protein [Rhodococcus maanshanensis]SEL72627.1 hypothetical protein SAMN05444583_113115 [Rhodococcus maanshanensis]
MAFVITQHISTARESAALRAICRAANRAWGQRNLTPQERANLYASRTPVAVITASMGGHPNPGGDRRW